MPILSDTTIKHYMMDNKLIIDGNLDNAEHCSYDFTAATIIKGGDTQFISVGEQGAVVEPGQLVWVRTKEKISMPTDMVGIWVQTQSLTRTGLLLLNMSIVEPGYEGYLTAVLVNFGKRNVVISTSSKIAKILFSSLDKASSKTCDSRRFSSYDKHILDIASNSPPTFLQLDTFIPSLESKAESTIKQLNEEIQFISRNIQAEMTQKISEYTNSAKADMDKEIRGDITSYVWKLGGGVIAGFIIACIAVWFCIGSILPQMLASYSKVETMVDKSIKYEQASKLDSIINNYQEQKHEIQLLKNTIEQLKNKNDSNKTQN